MATDLDARAVVSGFTEITETRDAPGFNWRRDYEALYRDCPSAFWLAPDADDLLANGGLPISHPARPVAQARPIEWHEEGVARGIFMAVTAAGPAFCLSLAIVESIASGGGTMWGAFAVAALFPPVWLVGAILALLPVCVGSVGLGWLGRHQEVARRPSLWAATGALMGAAIAAVFNSGPQMGIVLVLTSAACAALARIGISWSPRLDDADAPAERSPARIICA